MDTAAFASPFPQTGFFSVAVSWGKGAFGKDFAAGCRSSFSGRIFFGGAPRVRDIPSETRVNAACAFEKLGIFLECPPEVFALGLRRFGFPLRAVFQVFALSGILMLHNKAHCRVIEGT